MHSRMRYFLGGLLILVAGSARGQQLEFRSVNPSTANASPAPLNFTSSEAGVQLGKPVARNSSTPRNPAAPPVSRNEYFFDWARPIIRAQMGSEIPPLTIPTPTDPPPFAPGRGPAPVASPFGPPGTVTPPVAPVSGNPRRLSRAVDEDYKCAKVNDDADMGGFWSRTGQGVRHCWEDVRDGVTGAFTGRNTFQSDHRYDELISPVSNPHFFEDPRALTELRPVFIWQDTRSSNGVFGGGNNYNLDLQARVAFTENFSLVVNRLGWTWANPANPNQQIPGGNGFSEVHLGPKFSFEMFEHSIAAVGANFELGVGNQNVAQNTGNLSISPYFSFGTNFGQNIMPTGWGSFNFLNTTGYSLGIDSQRTDFFYWSIHFDYDVMGGKKFYPLVELNWTRYTFNGSARQLGFEGNNLFNFGSDGVAGHNNLSMAAGARYRFTNNIMVGAAAEWGLLGGSSQLDGFRLNLDVIFRY